MTARVGQPRPPFEVERAYFESRPGARMSVAALAAEVVQGARYARQRDQVAR